MKFKCIFLIVILSVSFNCNSQEYKKYDRKEMSMGSILSISVFSINEKRAIQLINECFEMARNIEGNVSAKNKSSIISKLNEKKELTLDDDFVYDLIKEAVDFSDLSKGYFDPSLYKLSLIWGFVEDEYKKDIILDIPDKDRIKNTLKNCGYKNIIFSDRKIILKNKISLDLGGIAEGKTIGEISNFLRSNGIKDYVINGGGDIIVGGLFANKRLWKIAIQDPFVSDKFIGYINLSDKCIVTSGDYERYFIGRDGQKYHHIMDPFTGYPARSELHSVTVIGKNSTLVDCFSTALFVMGDEKGLEFANKHKEIGAIFITGDVNNRNILTTNNIKVEKMEDNQYFFEYLEE